MEIKFTDTKIIQDCGSWLCLKIANLSQAKNFIDNKKDIPYKAKLVEWKEKRSLNANAYFWKLTGELATKIHIPVPTIYRQYIKDIGDNFQIVPIRNDAKEQWRANWESHGIGWVCEELGESKLNGYTNILCYYGSSTYNTAQMSRLIELVVQDCKDQGIETATPEELSLMKSRWNK